MLISARANALLLAVDLSCKNPLDFLGPMNLAQMESDQRLLTNLTHASKRPSTLMYSLFALWFAKCIMAPRMHLTSSLLQRKMAE